MINPNYPIGVKDWQTVSKNLHLMQKVSDLEFPFESSVPFQVGSFYMREPF